ncbi:hypothetical protein NESM_000686500 [Novymonas esmeraldas]|uniref:Uncharacterized protein n=1 Tax=Novymonas esmeraldas TaxID=1808958 RepID=A0AAW0EV05_9TRYP
MSSTTTSASAAGHVARNSARRMVRQLHHHMSEQRQAVMECRNRAEAMSASGIAHDSHVGRVQHPSPLCFVEVASEQDVKHNFIPYGPLSGIAVAVSDALDVQEFYTRSGLDTPMFHHVARKEFPIISWLRRQGAQFVGKLSCRTPFALSEGTVFGVDKPVAIAVTEHACDYAISCSLNGPSSVLCAVHHDMVGFKPTSQTFGTFTERFELTVPSMTVGLSARRVDDLMYLWQLYTASIDPEAYFESTTTKNVGAGTSNTTTTTTTGATPTTTDATVASSPDVSASGSSGNTAHETTAGELKAGQSTASTADDAPPPPPPTPTPSGSSSAGGATAAGQSSSRWWSGKATPEVAHPDDTPKYARPEILDHSPYNYTVRDRRGHIADIDVGWRDYNAEAAMADDFNRPSRPGLLRRLFTGPHTYETPQVELAVGYPAEWIDRYCTGKYASSTEFHQRITDAVYMHSALHYNQKLEIVPLAFDFSMEEVMEAVAVISQYELAKSFERLIAPASASAAVARAEADARVAVEVSDESGETPAGGATGNGGGSEGRERSAATTSPDGALLQPLGSGVPPTAPHGRHAAGHNRPHPFAALSGVLEELPATMVQSIQAGQRLSIRDYNRALRVRDDVVRATEEQFMDVDCFVTPLLSDPYVSGDVRSVRLTLPFQLAGNPILSVQVDPQTPVALIGELGRDAALMEDAFCLLQFVRGASPRWWRQRVFGDGAAATLGSGKGSHSSSSSSGSSGAGAAALSLPADTSTAAQWLGASSPSK